MRLTILIALVSLVSCLKTEVIGLQEHEDEAVVEKKRKPEPMPEQPDTTHTDERVPIGFEPSVEDWDEHEDINI